MQKTAGHTQVGQSGNGEVHSLPGVVSGGGKAHVGQQERNSK